MNRTDIPQSDVFFSWTGVDRAMKNQIVDYLRKHDISCTESDYACSGDFQQWSREAVSQSTVFLLLFTENTPKSKYVPLEIDAFLELEDWKNRCVPVVTDYALYQKTLPAFAEQESAVLLDEAGLTEDRLELILQKVRSLICQRLFSVYRQATAPTYLRFVSLLRELHMTAEFAYDQLYINRSVTSEDGQSISDASTFCKSQDIIYLYGPAGSGKTCYIDQLRNAADADTLVLALPCRRLVHCQNLFRELYQEFCRYCGNRHFYSEANFKSLLSTKHLLLILDGLDEIATKEGKDALCQITRDYYVANAADVTLFITCRTPEDAQLWKMNGQTPRCMELHPLEEDQIRDFGNRLFFLLRSPETSEAFYVSLHDLSEEIRTNPLLLSQLAVIYHEKKQLPQTVVGICDTVWEVIAGKLKPDAAAPAAFDSRILRKLSGILKSFSAEQYRLSSRNKVKTTEQIFRKVLRDQGFDPTDAADLIRYLQDRAILVGNEFYHKMLLEYFTAIYYYEQCFDDYGELEDHAALQDFFDRYRDPYWSTVVQMFLIKADSLADEEATETLYHAIMELGITDFTLLFDTCRDLLYRGKVVQTTLLTDILERSATGVYPPYGPLFWYVPEYGLYSELLSALERLQDAPCFTKALALARDVCWSFGSFYTAEAVNPECNGRALLAKATLPGIRKGLCELFYQGSTDQTDGADVYPRCFNLAEAKSWMDEGQGVFGRMNTAFADPLGLYSHEMLPEFGDEWVGIAAMAYDVAAIEEVLPSRSCKKLCGLFLSPTENTKLAKLAINGRHIRVLYLPENIRSASLQRTEAMPLQQAFFITEDAFLYFSETLTVPDGVEAIKSYAFWHCYPLASVCLPDSVKVIGEHTFAGCSSLLSIRLPDSLEAIGKYALRECSSLTSVQLPKQLAEIFDGTFAGCSALTTVNLPDSLETIGSYAFKGCSSLASIAIPERVTKIGDCGFSVCTALTSIRLPPNLAEIDKYTFCNCSSLASVTLPEGLITIGWNAFKGCCSLTSVTLSDGVTTIGSQAFMDCSSLTSITLPDSVTTIGTHAFEGCRSLSSITLPDSVTTIGSYAFMGCSSLSSITLPDGLREIEWYVFDGCFSLTTISLPNSITAICAGAFRLCCSLTAIRLPDSITKIGSEAFQDCHSLTAIRLPDRLTRWGGKLFQNCTALQHIDNCPASLSRERSAVPDGCRITYRQEENTSIDTAARKEKVSDEQCSRPEFATEIGDRAYQNRRDLLTVTVPGGITRIGDQAFSGCHNLTSVVIPNSVTQIGERAFYRCDSLASVTLPDSITQIGEGVFAGCHSLTSLTLLDSITQIGERAFEGCDSLTSLTLPDSVTQIRERAFAWCGSLTSITIPDSITVIGPGAFQGCIALTAVNLPDSLEQVGHSAFRDCSSLTAIALPNSLKDTGDWVFRGCSSLTSVILPESIKVIQWGVFEDCSSLAAIRFPDSLSQIRMAAFRGCRSLTSLVIPKSVRFIGHQAFAGCTGLREITLSRRFEDELSQIFQDVDLSEVRINWL